VYTNRNGDDDYNNNNNMTKANFLQVLNLFAFFFLLLFHAIRHQLNGAMHWHEV